MASYGLLGSYSTVQVLSPTFTNNVVYCTIRTQPSGAVVSMPIQEDVFNNGGGGPELTALADAVEQILARPEVIAAVGSQTIDANGLLADEVIFTVQYVPPGSTDTSITAEASVPVASLNFEDALIGVTLLESVLAIIEAVYNNLKATAAG